MSRAPMLTVLLAAASTTAFAQFACPSVPEAVTSINRDVKNDISLSVASLGKVKAGEVSIKTDTEAKNLFEKYPALDKTIALQTMAATYCSMLKSAELPIADKLDRWERFQAKVLQFEPTAVTPVKRVTITVYATEFINGNNVAVDQCTPGPGVLLNAQPCNARPNSAEFVVYAAVAGAYQLEAEYAAASARPVKLLIDQSSIRDSALSTATGGWTNEFLKWNEVGRVSLRQGPNTLRIERPDVFPHIRAFRFVPLLD